MRLNTQTYMSYNEHENLDLLNLARTGEKRNRSGENVIVYVEDEIRLEEIRSSELSRETYKKIWLTEKH